VLNVDDFQVITQENLDVHRDLVVAIDGGEGPHLEAAIEHHNRQMLAHGMFDLAASDPL
jgi:hypothetical protein